MKSYYKFFTVAVLLLFQSQEIFAQGDLQIFGFFQATIGKIDGSYSAVASVPKAIFGVDKLTLTEKSENNLNPSLQQFNLLLRKELTSNITAWVNFEILGNYNTKYKWGVFSLEEAWVNYQASDELNVKVGLITPRFAYLNEIKNRMPLLPYIMRPLIYESSIPAIDVSNYVPERAFAQISGDLLLGSVTLDYSAFFGPSESSYVTGTDGSAVGGTSVDTTNFKLFGGRIGAKIGELRLGVSGTYDKDNQQSTIKEDVPRKRLAFDLGYAAYNFFFEGEYISVNLDAKNTTEDQNKLFYYGTLGYNFTDDFFGYSTYSYMEDKGDDVLHSGMKGLLFGVGYKLAASVIVKAAYSSFKVVDSTFPLVLNPNLPAFDTSVNLDYKGYQLAVSVLF